MDIKCIGSEWVRGDSVCGIRGEEKRRGERNEAGREGESFVCLPWAVPSYLAWYGRLGSLG
jgi:hypothetical protein